MSDLTHTHVVCEMTKFQNCFLCVPIMRIGSYTHSDKFLTLRNTSTKIDLTHTYKFAISHITGSIIFVQMEHHKPLPNPLPHLYILHCPINSLLHYTPLRFFEVGAGLLYSVYYLSMAPGILNDREKFA